MTDEEQPKQQSALLNVIIPITLAVFVLAMTILSAVVLLGSKGWIWYLGFVIIIVTVIGFWSVWTEFKNLTRRENIGVILGLWTVSLLGAIAINAVVEALLS
jgi:lipopolysaccharide export LptBFGC system permease protein LptF